MTKFTMRNKVAEISKFLGKASIDKAVKADKDLIARMKYTSSAIKKGEKVDKATLLELANDCLTVMAAAETSTKSEPKEKKAKPKMESSLKKKEKKPVAKTEAKEEPKAEPKQKGKKAEPKAEPKKPVKSEAKKPEAKKPEKKVEPKQKKATGFSFPESFKDEDDAEYVRADDLETIEDVRKAMEADESLIVAAHWTPEMLKDGSYSLGQLPKKQIPKRFDNDLDLLSIVFVGTTTPNILTVSMYTEALYYWSGASLKQTKNGRKGTNLYFEIYRVNE